MGAVTVNLSGLYWLINLLRTELLDKWKIGIGNLTYWQFIIAIAASSIVIVALVNRVRFGSVFTINSKDKSQKGDDD